MISKKYHYSALCIVLKVLFLKKPQAVDFNFFESSSSGDDKTVNRTLGFFFQPMLWFSDGENDKVTKNVSFS